MNNIPLFVFATFSLSTHPSNGHLGYFHVLFIVNNAEINMGVQISLRDTDLNSFGYRTRTKFSGSYGRSIFKFFSNHHPVFHSGCTKLHFHQQCIRVTLYAHPQQCSIF